jgi:hypothetical protein
LLASECGLPNPTSVRSSKCCSALPIFRFVVLFLCIWSNLRKKIMILIITATLYIKLHF